jgi:hypothetical protein
LNIYVGFFPVSGGRVPKNLKKNGTYRSINLAPCPLKGVSYVIVYQQVPFFAFA